MAGFTQDELRFLGAQRRCRIATATPDGLPDVAVVAFSLIREEHFIITGRDLLGTIKYANVQRNPRAALVIDADRWLDVDGIFGIKVHGTAQTGVDGDSGKPFLEVTPERVWSWGLNHGAPKYFMGIIERRQFGA